MKSILELTDVKANNKSFIMKSVRNGEDGQWNKINMELNKYPERDLYNNGI